MNAVILTIGDELLDGLIVESNSTWMEQQLLPLGVQVTAKLAVRDRHEAIADALAWAVSRLETGNKPGLVIITGGLGPTVDDLTREAVAGFLRRELTFDPAVYKTIAARFARFKIPLPEVNKRQAMVIDGSLIVKNPQGTAPGFIIPPGENCPAIIAAFPGVPRELHGIFPTLTGYVRDNYPPEKPSVSVMLRTVGNAESFIDEELQKADWTGIRVGTIAHPSRIDIRFDVDAPTKDEALLRVKEKLRDFPAITRKIYAESPAVTLEETVLELLAGQGQTLAVAESCTGGMLSQALTAIPGSSRAFLGGVVSYANSLKREFLGVTEETLERFGAVSFDTAAAMAEGLKSKTGADFALSITGVAGPSGGSETKPVGTVFMGLICPRYAGVFRFRFHGERDMIRARSVSAALELLWQYLHHGQIEPETIISLEEYKSLDRS